MSITLKAEIHCDHKNCSNTTTSDNVSIGTYSQYDHEIPYIEVSSFDDKGWISFSKSSYCRGPDIKYYCPEHHPKQKKVKL